MSNRLKEPPPRSISNVLAYLPAITGTLSLMAFLGMMAVALYTPFTAFDDSYMFVRYARNLWEGYGYTWNTAGPPADGLTSPLWFAVVALFYPLASQESLEQGAFLATLSFASTVLLTIALYVLARLNLPPRLRVLAILAPFWLTISAFNVGGIAGSGMETALAALALVLLLWRVSALQRAETFSRVNGVGLGAGIFLGILARPEFGLFLGMPLIAILVYRKTHPHFAAAMSKAFVAAFLLLCLYAIWRIWMFGTLLPLSFSAKGNIWNIPYEDYSPEAAQRLRAFVFYYLKDSFHIHLAIWIGLSRNRLWLRMAHLWVPLYGIVLYLSTTFQLMGHGHRYYIPTLCGLLVLLLLAWLPEKRNAPTAADHRITAFFDLLTAIALAICAWGYATYPWLQRRQYATKPVPSDVIQTPLGAIPEGTRVAATEVGRLGVLLPQATILDLAGLNSPEYTQGFDADVFFAQQPDVITLVHPDYRAMNRAILEDPRFIDNYACGQVFLHIGPATCDQLLSSIHVRKDWASSSTLRLEP
ncbi:MAG: hypothetical protein RLY93_01790 [Sumerlaeia bacterium]